MRPYIIAYGFAVALSAIFIKSSNLKLDSFIALIVFFGCAAILAYLMDHKGFLQDEDSHND